MTSEDQNPDVMETPVGSVQAEPGAEDLVLVSEVLSDRIPVRPMAPRPLFPYLMLPLTFTGPRFAADVRSAADPSPEPHVLAVMASV